MNKMFIVGVLGLLLIGCIGFIYNIDEDVKIENSDKIKYGIKDNKLFIDDGNILFEAEIKDGGHSQVLRSKE